MEISLRVLGSTKNEYEVIFRREGQELSTTCSCAAGERGQFCNHRIAVLEGDTSAVLKEFVAQAKNVAGWLPGSAIEQALNACKAAQKKVEQAKAEEKKSKNALSAALRGNAK